MLGVLFVVRLVMGYQFQSIASVSTQLVERFGFSYAQIGTLIGFFLLPGAFMAIPSGILTRAASDKTLLMAGAALMAAGSMVLVATVSMVLMLRLLQARWPIGGAVP